MRIIQPINDTIYLGMVNENTVTQVKIDISKLVEEFGVGTVSLIHKRPTFGAYVCENVTTSNNNVVWTIVSTDVLAYGPGELQLTYTVSSSIAKTHIYKTWTERSIKVETAICSNTTTCSDTLFCNN